MNHESKLHVNYENGLHGFSLVELLIVLTMVLVVTSMALLSLQPFRSYQLNDAATQMAGMLKFTRFEAIRRNKSINCLIRQPGTSTTNVWTDPDGDGVEDATEKQILFSGSVGPVSAGSAPGTSALATAVGVGTLTPVSLTAGTITFDARGAANTAVVAVIYFGNTSVPGAGYRAVVLLPSGALQVWLADSGGNWIRVS